MSEFDWFAWAVGFWEGEGSVGLAGTKKNSLRLCAYQKDKEPLIRLQEVFGVGRIYGPYSTGYQWQATGADAWECAERIMPYLSQRRKDQLNSKMEKAVRWPKNTRQEFTFE